MATKKAAKKTAVKKTAVKKTAVKKTAKKRTPAAPKMNLTGVIVPDDCQTCTILFAANVTLTAGKAKRVQILATGSPISKLSVTD